jgi:hypothetical protein
VREWVANVVETEEETISVTTTSRCSYDILRVHKDYGEVVLGVRSRDEMSLVMSSQVQLQLDARDLSSSETSGSDRVW